MLKHLFHNRFLTLGLILGLLMTTLFAYPLKAEARHYYGYSNYYGRSCNRNHYYGGGSRYGVDYKTGKIIKGGLVGAGIGAGSGLITGRPVGRTALIGAGLGAGVQATRYSSYMRRHPIVRTAAYGALTGTGVSAMTGDGRHLGQGALWGGGIGAGLGALSRF